VNSKIFRKYLEINSIKDLKEVLKPSDNYSLENVNPTDFQINKFLYKQIGKKYHWIDRLEWSDKHWIKYISNKNLSTTILKDKKNIAGYFESIFHDEKKEVEIVYFGIMEEYFGKKLGGFLLSEAIKKSFLRGAKKVWVHTSSLDHKNALDNYLSRGMRIFKSNEVKLQN
jgi:ribosomal protein S18 acetylase RimI-like enzyme